MTSTTEKKAEDDGADYYPIYEHDKHHLTYQDDCVYCKQEREGIRAWKAHQQDAKQQKT